MADEYTLCSPETVARLWPEAETRPAAAWKHLDCGLIVTDRAAHDPRFGQYPCPSPRPERIRSDAQP